jgi:pimeloyl-ACP methyl ester carboxylesterase
VPQFFRDGIVFDYIDRGQGPAFLFQHGLGAQALQPAELIGEAAPFRLVAMSGRGHGATPPGDPRKLSIEAFADDLAALAAHLGLGRAIVGGISMGAAVALRLALRHPALVERLVLVRPAWLTDPAPTHLAILRPVARHLRAAGRDGVAAFVEDPAYARVLAQSPDNAASLCRQFEADQPEARATLLERVLDCDPGIGEADLAGLRAPTLVLANGEDPMHPLALAEKLARLLPAAELRRVTSKSVDPARHVEEVRRAIGKFLGDPWPW